MTVSEIMHSDFLYSCQFNLPFHLMLYRFLNNWKQSFCIRHSVVTIYKFLNFLFQKFWNFDCSKGLFCFWFCDNILHSCSVISLIDTKLILFKIDISFCNRKQLPDPASSPEQHLKHKIISCSRLHCLYKLFVLVQCPEVQTSRIRISHSFHFLAWINWQIIYFSCMCKQTGQLILNHSQIRI